MIKNIIKIQSQNLIHAKRLLAAQKNSFQVIPIQDQFFEPELGSGLFTEILGHLSNGRSKGHKRPPKSHRTPKMTYGRKENEYHTKNHLVFNELSFYQKILIMQVSLI